MSRKGSSSTTQNTSTTSYSDQSVNVAEGGLAAAAGSTVTINDLSEGVALGALAANQNVSGMALDTAARALQVNQNVADIAITANRDVNLASLDTTSRLAETAINTVVGLGEVASRERIDTLETTNLALSSQQGLANKFAELASASLERSQTPDSAVTKQLLWVVAAIVVAVAFILSRNRKTA